MRCQSSQYATERLAKSRRWRMLITIARRVKRSSTPNSCCWSQRAATAIESIWSLSFACSLTCTALLATRRMSNGNFSAPEAKRDLPKICSVKPPERMKRIKELPELLLKSPSSKKILDSFGVEVDTDLVPVPTKMLNAPTLITPTKSFEYRGIILIPCWASLNSNCDQGHLARNLATNLSSEKSSLVHSLLSSLMTTN